MVNEVIHNNSSTTDSTDRVRNHTPASFNQKIDAQLTERLHHYANQSKAAISERIEALKYEWDIERVLELNAFSLAVIGVMLSLTADLALAVANRGSVSVFVPAFPSRLVYTASCVSTSWGSDSQRN